MVFRLGRSQRSQGRGGRQDFPRRAYFGFCASSKYTFQHIYPVSELRDSFRLKAIMSDERKQLEEHSKLLRTELKVWEKQFGRANGGKRPARQDIKANPDIGRLLIEQLLVRVSSDSVYSVEIQRI